MNHAGHPKRPEPHRLGLSPHPSALPPEQPGSAPRLGWLPPDFLRDRPAGRRAAGSAPAQALLHPAGRGVRGGLAVLSPHRRGVHRPLLSPLRPDHLCGPLFPLPTAHRSGRPGRPAVRGGRPLPPGPPPAAVPQRGRGVPGGLLPAPLSGELAVGGAADCSAVPALAGHLCPSSAAGSSPCAASIPRRRTNRAKRRGRPCVLVPESAPPALSAQTGPCRQTGGTAPLCSYSCSIWLLTRWMIMSRATAFLPPSGTMRSA